ncbi:MAG TPA: MlaD family protein [Bacteroidia bacterium]|nr:MlaD family protein [Bacteroidia bacterium]
MKLSREVKTGIVVVIAIALGVYGFNYLRGSDLFKKDFTLYAMYNKSDGLIEASPVTVNGYRVGQIKKLTLVPFKGAYKVLVSLMISEKVNIPIGSHAKIVSSDLLGTKAVEIMFADTNVFVNMGDTLLPDVEDNLQTAVDKRIAPLQKKAENLISSIDSVMQVVQKVMNANVRASLVASFESIKTTIQSLQHTAFTMDTLTTTQQGKIIHILDKLASITSNIEKNNDKISNILTNFSDISDSIAKSNIKSTIERTNLALLQANDILAQINSGKGTVGKLIKNDSLYNNLNNASKDLDALFKDLNDHPKRYVHFSIFGRKDRKPKK